MLKHKEPNILSVFGVRRVDHCPPHFSGVKFDLSTNEKRISDWIWENLEGRFFYGDIYSYDSNNKVTFSKMAAFEIPGESSYFALMLNQINNNTELDF